MKILNFAGFPMKDTYTIIKAISKKKVKKIAKVKPKFIECFAQKILESGDANDKDKSCELANKVWGIVEDFSHYGFNSPHGFSYAIDSVTQAYQKAHYPYEFYEVVLQRFTEKGEKDKVSLLKQEMKYFNIELKPIKFRDDNRGFTAYKEKGYITQPLNSIKNISKNAPQILYDMRNIEVDNFVDLLVYITENTNLNKTSMEILIKLDYFSEFGSINNLLETYKYFKEKYKKTYVETTKIKRICMVKDFFNNIDKETSKIDMIRYQIDILGYTDITLDNCPDGLVIALGVELNQYGTPFATLYSLKTGKTTTIKVNKYYYETKIFKKLDLINIISIKNEKKRWIKDRDEYELILKSYNRVVEND